MIKSQRKIIAGLLSLFIPTLFSYAQNSGAIKLKAEKLHGRTREWPYPANGITVPTNAPALLWPANNGSKMIASMESGSELPDDPNVGNVLYQVVLATNKAFTKNVIKGGWQAWAVFPLHQPLKQGKWYWKYNYKLKTDKKWTTSAVYDFVVDKRYTGKKVSPPVAKVLQRNEGPHPRLWDMHRKGGDFYKNNQNNPEAKRFLAYAEKLMDAPLPVEKPMRMIDTTGKTALEKKNIKTRMYHGFGDFVGKPISALCVAYQLSHDKRFILDAKRRAINVMDMGVNGPATSDDFTSGAILEALGWFYDAGYNFLTDAERLRFRAVIRLRGKRVYDHLPNRFEVHVSDNHIWQITMGNLMIATLAVTNEVPEAKEWLTYLYEIWSARFPVLGTTDGGWHEGNGYFKVNYRTTIYLSQLFGDLAGVNYFELPWMQNLPYYLIYTHPLQSATTAYGDMWENTLKMTPQQGLFAQALSLGLDNPYLNYYVAQIKKENPEYFKKGNDDYLMYRLLRYNPARKMEEKSFVSLPLAKTFRDVGVSAMHTNLVNTSRQISLYLLSNPFGSSGHGSASQNAFTLNYKGKTIFGGTGYYGNFSDRHNLLYYRTSRAYSTILVDSLSQKIGEEGYGWIPRELTGKYIRYALGDASNAYGNIKSAFWLNRFDQLKVDPKTTGVYGNVGVTLYRRHALQLEGGIVVLYDELEAKKPVKWTTQYHAPFYKIVGKNQINANKQQFVVDNNLGNVQATVFANSPIGMDIHNRFAEPAENWAKVNDGDGNIKEFKLQWHAGITSRPAQKFRYLTIIQIKDGLPEIVQTVNVSQGLHQLKVGNWQIFAQLDANAVPVLQAINPTLKAGFAYGSKPLVIDNQQILPKAKGSSMLVEANGNQWNKLETLDILPDVAKFDVPK